MTDAAEDSRSEGNATDHSEAGRRSVGTSFSVVSQLVIGFVGLLALLSYPVGLVTLWVQVRSEFGYDGWSALYLASLVPKTMVIAKTATFLSTLLPALALVGGSSYIFSYLFQRRLRGVILSLTVLLGLIYLSIEGYGLYEFGSDGALTLHTFELTVYAVAPCLSLLTGLLIGGRAVQMPARHWSGRDAVALYTAAILISGVLAGLRELHLPKVTLDSGEHQTEVSIFAHSNGYWHVLCQKGVMDRTICPEGSKGAVRAVADEGVVAVQFLEN